MTVTKRERFWFHRRWCLSFSALVLPFGNNLRFGGDDYEFTRKEVVNIEEFRNSNGKRVCDISKDRRVIVISQKGCITQITANPDGTLSVVNIPHAA